MAVLVFILGHPPAVLHILSSPYEPGKPAGRHRGLIISEPINRRPETDGYELVPGKP